jgi:hypothetical protein
MIPCDWKAHNPRACGDAAVALVYSGVIEQAATDAYWKPRCAAHAGITARAHTPASTPLSDGGTWIVGLRQLPPEVTP